MVVALRRWLKSHLTKVGSAHFFCDTALARASGPKLEIPWGKISGLAA